MKRFEIFAYGTLLNPAIQESIIGSEIKGTPDELIGYRKTTVTIDSHTYPDLVADSDSSVSGKILSVTAEELERIDAYEGQEYKRIKLRLSSGKTAFVYLATWCCPVE